MILYCWCISDRLNVLFRSKHEERLHCLHLGLYNVHCTCSFIASTLNCWSFSPIDTNQFIVLVLTIFSFTQLFLFQFVSKQYKDCVKTADLIFWKSVQCRLKIADFISWKLMNSWSITPFYCVQNSSMTVHLYFLHIHPVDILRCLCTLILNYY